MATGPDSGLKAPKNAKCAGHRVSGYWKGYACGARPSIQWKGHWYCKNHVPYAALFERDEAGTMNAMVGG